MKLWTFLLLLTLATRAEPPAYSEDSKRQQDVPKGAVTHHIHASEIYPGTLREFYVYIPAQYEPGTEAALMVFQDGHSYVGENGPFRTPIVFDNLIHSGEMPVTVGVFVNPGLFTEKLEGRMGWKLPEGVRMNRADEYDALTDDYVRMLETEILPQVEEMVTLSKKPRLRAICGSSSGGICAFTAAWQRPDLFQKVVSHIGSFVNIRGGHVYPAVIRKAPKRDLKIYLQDGSNDLDNEHGNWWLANLQMEAALKFRNYDYKWQPDDGGHGPEYGGPQFPETLRWLWQDWKEESE